METLLRLGTVFFDLAAPMIVGYFFHRKNLISDHTNQILMKINIRVLVTILAWLSFWILPLKFDVLLVPIFALVTITAPFCLAYIFFARFYPNPFDRGPFLLSSTLSSVGKLGGLVGYMLFGEVGFAYVQIIATIHNMLTLVAAFPMANFFQCLCEKKSSQTKLNINFRDLFFSWNQIGLLGMFLGIFLQLCGIERPKILGDLFQSLMHTSVWIAILPIGYLIDFEKIRKWLKKSISVLAVHFVLSPALTMIFAKIFVEDEAIRGIILISSACPAAINAVVATKLYKLNVDFAMASYMFSTGAYLFVVIPILFWLLH